MLRVYSFFITAFKPFLLFIDEVLLEFGSIVKIEANEKSDPD